MLRIIITYLTLFCFVVYIYGCSSIEVVQPNDSNIEDINDSEIVSVVTVDNKIYEFETNGIRPKPEIRNSVLVGWAKEMGHYSEFKIKEVQIRIDNIQVFNIEKPDYLQGGLATILAFSLILGFPFILMIFKG